MSAISSETGKANVLAQAWLDGALCSALDQAARDGRDSRAGYLRRIIVESLRTSGHLDPIPTPRRYRAKRRSEATA